MKKPLLIILFMAAVSFCFAQKSSSKTMTISYTVSPTHEPASNVSYSSVLVTPLDVIAVNDIILSKDREMRLPELAREYLQISGSRYIKSESKGDWLVKLETGNMSVVSTSEKPWGELEATDPVFTYTCPAKLTVTDKSGTTIFEKVIAGETEERKMAKASMLENPKYAAKYALVKNNPEKLAKLAKETMDNASYIVLRTTLYKADNAIADAFENQVRTAHVSIFSVKGKAYGELSDISENIFETDGKVHALSKKNRIPKEEMDKAMLAAVPVWEKYVAEHPELEAEARKGLILNCALANTYAGDYDKSAIYLDKVEEAKKTNNITEADDMVSGGNSLGATIMLSFKQSAENLRNMYEYMKEYKSRMKID